METYLAAYERYLTTEKHASANTVSSYMRDLRQFASYAKERQLTPQTVTETHISTYLDYLSGQGKSTATVSRSLASLKGFFHRLVDTGVLEENPAAHVTAGKIEKKLPQVLTGKEV
jgi:integrase/recombinase XerD